MNVVVLRDPDEAQKFLLQGLCLQRAMAASASSVKQVLEWGLEIAAGGQPLLPLGVIADFGHAAYGIDRDGRQLRDSPAIHGLLPTHIRAYEDHVLGKIYADWSFERASDAMRRYQGRDRAIGLAYLVRQFRERANLGGVELSPGNIRSLVESQPEELLRRGWESLTEHGPSQHIIELYEAVVMAARGMAEILALEDVIALEHRTALADMGQYVAHRQVLQIANLFEERLPQRKVKPLAGRQEVPTRVLDEDTYPVGGFASISTKGSVESLLHSQLAFMEHDPRLRPDLFDVKFLRDELYYYSRDENQFLRRRRAFVFCLFPDLVKGRYKDPDLPVQRIVMVLGMLLTAIRKLSEWLSTDALKFEFLLISDDGSKPLRQEGTLLEMLLREQIENKTVEIRHFGDDPSDFADRLSQRSICHLLAIGSNEIVVKTESAIATGLIVQGPRPKLSVAGEEAIELPADDAVESWTQTLERLLMLWI